MNIVVKYKKSSNSSLNNLMDGIALKISGDVTDYLHFAAMELANGGTIPKVESKQEDKMAEPQSLANLIRTVKAGKASDHVKSTVTSTSEHSTEVEFGTGLYGDERPDKKLIVAKDVGKHKKVFFFKWKGEEFFLPYTKGQYPKPFMRGAIYKLRYNLNRLLKGK